MKKGSRVVPGPQEFTMTCQFYEGTVLLVALLLFFGMLSLLVLSYIHQPDDCDISVFSIYLRCQWCQWKRKMPVISHVSHCGTATSSKTTPFFLQIFSHFPSFQLTSPARFCLERRKEHPAHQLSELRDRSALQHPGARSTTEQRMIGWVELDSHIPY